MCDLTLKGYARTCEGSFSAKGLQSPMPSDWTKLLRSSQNTRTELSDMPTASKLHVWLMVVQLTCLLEFSKLIEPIDGRNFSESR